MATLAMNTATSIILDHNGVSETGAISPIFKDYLS